MGTNPKTVTIYGRLSFPRWTAQEAYDRSQGSKFPAKSVAEAKPEFTLLVEDGQLAKLMDHVTNVFLPYCIEQNKKGEKSDNLSDADVKKLMDQLTAGTFADPTYNTPFKELSDKSKEMAPECVASVKCVGNAGVDLELKAIVQDESELAVPDPDQIKFPVIKPLNESVHSMYPGCYVAVTINLYAYHNGNLPGFSAGASVAIFKADAERFGGGVAVDEDAIFADD